MIEISYIICTYNRSKYLKKALQAIVAQENNYNDIFEIIIVDNNSTDDTRQVVEEFIRENQQINIVYCIEQKQGLSNARNKGIETAKGTWLVFLDDDAYIDKHYTKNLINFIKDNNNIYKAIGGPIYLDFVGKIPVWYTKYLGSLLGYFKPYTKSRKFGKNYYPRGSNMIFNKILFEKYGIFNPNLGRFGNLLLGSEEKDIFQRIYKAKEPVYYLDNIITYHIVHEFRTTKEFIKKQSIGVGLSERLRINGNVKLIIYKIFSELLKWAASLALFLFYALKGSFQKGIMLIKFRYWILKGLITNKNVV